MKLETIGKIAIGLTGLANTLLIFLKFIGLIDWSWILVLALAVLLLISLLVTIFVIHFLILERDGIEDTFGIKDTIEETIGIEDTF